MSTTNQSIDIDINNGIFENPLLSRIKLPGETYRLPSGGILYTQGELDANVKDGEVHVYPMTTIDDLILRSPDKLFSGNAIKEVFSRCIPSILNVDDMFYKDIDYLMLCLRKVSYGNEMEQTFTHDCEKAKPHSYIIDLNKVIKATKPIDPTTIDATFSVTLKNGQVVQLQPLLYKHMVEILQSNDNKEKDYTDKMVHSIVNTIKQVDEITDKKMIEGWLRAITVGMANQIKKSLNATAEWGPVSEYKIKCKDCGKMFDVSVNTNSFTFFLT